MFSEENKTATRIQIAVVGQLGANPSPKCMITKFWKKPSLANPQKKGFGTPPKRGFLGVGLDKRGGF
jgi:hypothetical protein